MGPRILDHVALWVAGRDAITANAERELGMHVIERTDRFTLVGGDPRRGKLTLFAAEGPRDPGALLRIGFRALAGEPRAVDLGEGLQVRLRQVPGAGEYDLDHVALRVPDPEASARRWLEYGFVPAEPGEGGVVRVRVGEAFLELHAGEPGSPEQPLLNHLGVLVDSVEEQVALAAERGLEADEVVDAANTISLFVWAPDGVKLEYVEHKPSFSLT